MKRWIRKLFAPSQHLKTPRNRLNFLSLEDRITPDIRQFGGLVFDATNTFSGQSVTGPVKIRLADNQPVAIQLDNGVTLSSDGITFTTTGQVQANSKGTFLPILNSNTHKFTTTQLNAVANPTAAGVTVAAGETVAVSILGSQLTPSNIKLVGTSSNPVVQLDGNIGFSVINSFSAPLAGGGAAQIGSLGAVYNKDFAISFKGKTFDFKSLKVEAKDLSIGFQQSSSSFFFDGTASISNNVTAKDKNGQTKKQTLNGVSAQFGDGTNHGIVINSNGSLQSVFVKVNGNLQLGGLKLNADNITLGYDSVNSRLQFSGGVNVELSSAIRFGAAITQPIAIDTATGDVSFPNGFGIAANVQLGPFGADAKIEYLTDDNFNYFVKVEASVHLTSFDVKGKFTIENGSLTQVKLEYTPDGSAGIALGNTGLFVTSFGGTLENLNDPSNIIVSGDVGVTFGKKISFLGHEYAIFDAKGGFRITKDSLTLTGQVNLAGGFLGKGNGSVDINWTRGEYKVHIDAELMQVFKFNGDLAFDNIGNITLSAMAGVQFPSSIPFIGGQQFGNINVYMQIRPQETFDNSYVAAWTNLSLGALGSPTIGFQYNFNKTLNILTAAPTGFKDTTQNNGLYPANYNNFKLQEVVLPSEVGVDSYFVTVKSPRFSALGYSGNNDIISIDTNSSSTLSGNQQVTIDAGSFNNKDQARYFFAVNEKTSVPHEQDQYSLPGSKPDERVFVLPRKYFQFNLDGKVKGGKITIGLISKSEIKEPLEISYSTRYLKPHAIATEASVDKQGVTTIDVAGTAYGLNADKTIVSIYRTLASNPSLGTNVATVLLDRNDPNQHYNPATGSFFLSTTWGGLPDLTVSGKNSETYIFQAQINDGSNPVISNTRFRDVITSLTSTVDVNSTVINVARTDTCSEGEYIQIGNEKMLIIARSSSFIIVERGQLGTGASSHLSSAEVIRIPNATNPVQATPAATIDLLGFDNTPDYNVFFNKTLPYVSPITDNAAPGGFSYLLGANGPSIIVGQSLALKTQVSVQVNQGGFIGVGSTINVLAGEKTQVTMPAFGTLAEANAYLKTIRFVANSQFTGTSIITITVKTQTLLNTIYSTSTQFQILSHLFFLDPNQGGNYDTIRGDLNTPLNGGKGYQIKFAPGFNSAGPYTFSILNGDSLPAGLTISESGLISGSPSAPTLGSDGLIHTKPIRLYAYDKYGYRSINSNLFVFQFPGDLSPTPFDDNVTMNQIENNVRLNGLLDNDLFPFFNLTGNAHPVVNNGTIGKDLSLPSHGTVIFDGAAVVYTPYPGFVGVDTFQYSISTAPSTRIATVTVNVTPFSFVVDNVTNTNDGKYGTGELTLNEAILLSNSPKFPGRQTITFDSNVFSTPQSITLDDRALTIEDAGIDIIGPGAGLLSINGNSQKSTQGVFINHAKTTISGLTITNGNSESGGGLLNIPTDITKFSETTALTLNNCILRNNRAELTESSYGGAIENILATLTINNCTITENTATASGGGLSNFKGIAFINNSTISNNNTLEDGGGLQNLVGTLTLTNVTISGNRASKSGGGISNPSEPGTLTVLNCTITGNYADSDNNSTVERGGGIYTSTFSGDKVTLLNTIVAGNYENGSISNLQNVSLNDIGGLNLVVVPDSKNNLIGDPTSSGGLTNGINGNIVGNGGQIWNIDLILNRNLQDNGGVTQTLALITGSPAVNAGSNSCNPSVPRTFLARFVVCD